MQPLTEKSAGSGNYIISEANRHRSRENIVVSSGSGIVLAGTILGVIFGVGSVTAGTNTGNGVVTLGAVGQNVQQGTYRLVARTAGATAVFDLISPDGNVVRQVTTGSGAAANDHVTVTIADGAADFIVGDSFTFNLTRGEYKPLNLAGTDGSQNFAAICYADIDATDADVTVAADVRECEVNGWQLIWPEGITDPQKTAAAAQMLAQQIIIRF